MDDLASTHAKLTLELSQTQELVAEQRTVIMALGQLVTEMAQTITHYERLLDEAAQQRNAGQVEIH